MSRHLFAGLFITLAATGCAPERSICFQELMEYGFVLNEDTLCADRADGTSDEDSDHTPVLFLYDENDLESEDQLSPSAEAKVYTLKKDGDHLELSREEARLLCADVESITENLYLLGGESAVINRSNDENNLICVY